MTPRRSVPTFARLRCSPLLNASIERLQQEQHQLKAFKKCIQKELRNAERKRKCLLARARQLTDEDIASVMFMRKEKKNGTVAAAAAGSPESKHDAADALVHGPGA